MKFKYIFLFIFISCIYSSILSQEKTSVKVSFKFDNSPKLLIESIIFDEEKPNQLAEPGENCNLIVKIKNSGGSTAKMVDLQLSSPDSLQSYLSFKKSFPLGDIPINETKEINIPLNVGICYENVQLPLKFVAHESNNYDSKPSIKLIALKQMDAVIDIFWHHPSAIEMLINDSVYTLNACIETKAKIEILELYINDKLYKVNKDLSLKRSENCDNYFEQKINLSEGSNTIKLVVKNKQKSAESELRTLNYQNVEFEYRTALVIGNSNYSAGPLKNASNDAKSMANTLNDLKFDVITVIDGNKKEMEVAIDEFINKINERKGIGLLFYAGHGMEVDGINYLIPIKHNIKKSVDVTYEAICVNKILDYMQFSGTRMNILILDACRDNPLPRSTRSNGRGLAEITGRGTGSIIAYATAPGSVASDGAGDNGLYTQELLKAIKTPGLEIGMVFRNVHTNVKKISNGTQLPWTNLSVEGEFYFIK